MPASKTKLRKTSSAHTQVATMEIEMRNLTLKKNRLLTTGCQIWDEVVWDQGKVRTVLKMLLCLRKTSSPPTRGLGGRRWDGAGW